MTTNTNQILSYFNVLQKNQKQILNFLKNDKKDEYYIFDDNILYSRLRKKDGKVLYEIYKRTQYAQPHRMPKYYAISNRKLQITVYPICSEQDFINAFQNVDFNVSELNLKFFELNSK